MGNILGNHTVDDVPLKPGEYIGKPINHSIGKPYCRWLRILHLLTTVVNIPLFIGFPPCKVVQDFATIAGIQQFHIWNYGNCSYCYWMLMVYGRHMCVSEHGGFPSHHACFNTKPWSSMTTGWFGGPPKFREPPYGNIGINQCISCYIMCVHIYIYMERDISWGFIMNMNI